MPEAVTPEAEGPLTLAAAAQILSKSLPDEGTGDEPEPQKQPVSEQPTGDEGLEVEPEPEQDSEPPVEPEPASDSPEAEEFDFNAHKHRLVPIKIGGKEEKVTLEEALRGYQRNKDYTQKTQAVAEQAKALAAKSDEITQQAARYVEGLKAVEDVLAAAMPAEPDEALRKSNPGEYAARVADNQRSQKKLDAVRAERQRVMADYAEKQQAALDAHVRAEFAKLAEQYPAWKDDAKRTAHMTQISDYAKTVGYTPEEIAGIIDARAVTLLDKARLWDAHVARTKGAKEVVQQRMKAAPVIKPGSGKQSVPPQQKPKTALDAAKSKFSKSRSLQDAADVLAMLVDE